MTGLGNIDDVYKHYLKVIDENANLKKLLRECKEVIKNVDTYYGNYDSTNGYLVINKIDEALRWTSKAKCKEFFEEENPKDFTVISERMDDLLTSINTALGGSEE